MSAAAPSPYFVSKRRVAPSPAETRTPAARIVRLLGGPAVTAELAGRKAKSVYRWLQPKTEGGTGGRVPAAVQDLLIAAASARGIALDHADFTPKNGEAFT